MSQQNKNLLRKGNTELSGLGIFVWSIPALVAKSEKFGLIKTCPNGACAALCYARTGRYRFNNVINAHTRNLNYTLTVPTPGRKSYYKNSRKEVLWNRHPHKFGWKPREDFQWWTIRRQSNKNPWFWRLFYEYLRLDRRCTSKPSNLIYAYTKQVFSTKSEDRGLIPHNLVFIFSMGEKRTTLSI